MEDDVVGQEDGDGVGVGQGDEDGEGVVVEQGDEGELGVVERQGVVWWWDWERARQIHWCGEDSLDLSGRLGSSGVCPGSVLLVVRFLGPVL